MEISKYTLQLSSGEMFEMAHAIMDSIEMRVSEEAVRGWNTKLWELESELKLLQTFSGRGYGFELTVDKRVEGSNNISHWEPNPKTYHDAEEWFEALLKQRKKEYGEKNKNT